MIRLRKIYFFVFLCVLVGQNSISFSQDVETHIVYDTVKTVKKRIIRIIVVRTVPKFILQLSGSFNSGAMELQGHNGGFILDDVIKGRSYGARNGYGVYLAGKLPLHKKGNFWLDVATAFNRFQSNLVTDNTKEGKVYYNVFSGEVGADYMFTPNNRVKYFVEGNIVTSIITGKLFVPPDFTNPTGPIKEVKIDGALRIGYTVCAGLEYAFEKNFGINFGLRFTHSNLFLKKTTVPTSDFETTLNDDSSELPVLYGGWKQFAFVSGFAGFSYYFGVKERRYKLP
jgi:opacity protein-like surface antigen